MVYAPCLHTNTVRWADDIGRLGPWHSTRRTREVNVNKQTHRPSPFESCAKNDAVQFGFLSQRFLQEVEARR